MTNSNLGGDTAVPDDEELRLYQRAYLAQQQADTLYLRWEACMAHALLLEQNPGKIYHDHAGLNGRQLGEGARAAARRFALLLAEPPAFAEDILALKIAVYEAMARDDDEMRRSRAAPMIEMAMHADAKDLGIVLSKVPIGMDPRPGNALMAGHIFYDLECTGLTPAFDVPVQAALVRTCDDLVVQDELVLRARPPDHIVPSPEAMLVTGLRPRDLIDPLDQLGMMQAIAAFIEAAAPATIIGFNSLKYDEEMLRQAFFQNLPPYLTSLGGHRRADVLVMARAVAALDPGAIRVPEQKGKPSFRLGELCRMNGICLTEEDAHDALVDVRATIELFRLLRDRSPAVMAALMENADKRHVQARLDAGGVLGLLAFGTITPVTSLMTAPANPSSMAVADLSVDPGTYLDLSPTELLAVMTARGERPIRTVKLNAQPVLLPWKLCRHAVAPCEAEEVYLERIRQISAHDGIWKTLPDALGARFADRTPSPWPDGQLYDRFIPNGDARACVTWHRLDWDRRSAFAAESFADDRLRAFANRHAFLTAPQTLCENGRRKGRDWLRHRLTTSEDVPWLTLPRALARCAELKVASDDDSERSHLDEIALWLAERLKAAQSSL